MAVISRFRAMPARRAAFVLLLVLLLTALILGGIFLLDPYRCQIAPDVTVGGLEVGGMTFGEARDALEQSLSDSLYSQSLSITLPEENIVLSPEEIHPEVETGKAVWDAYRFGRFSGQTDPAFSLSPYLTFRDGDVQSLLEAYAQKHDTRLTQPEWTLSGEAPVLSTDVFADEPPQTLLLTLGLPEAALDVPHAMDQIRSILADAISACKSNQYALDIAVTPSQLPLQPDLDSIRSQICSEAISDSLDMEAYRTVPGAYGYTFDADAAREALENAAPGETVSVEMILVKPKILGDQVYFRDVLGTCETRHNNNENRNTNLRLLCKALDGFILQPGEEFSYNAVVGERTRERGYKPAPAYSGNRLVDSVGGGVCQGSTTIYNCVLLADLEVTFRACHGASVGYVPAGLDAAVNWLTTDFKFRNNFHFPIMIRAEVSDGYVKMKILGTDEKDYYIKMESRSGEDDIAVYARSYKCKYSKETGELLSREVEAYSTYYKNIG